MTAKEIAQYIIGKSVSKKKYVNNWKIQYLLYYIQQKFYDTLGRKAFDEPMVAWALGPVVVEVKKEIEKTYGPLEIKKIKGNIIDITDEKEKRIIDSVIKDYSGIGLGHIMKTEMANTNGLWKKTYDEGKGRNKEIVFGE